MDAAYLCFLLLGTGALLPFNALVTAADCECSAALFGRCICAMMFGRPMQPCRMLDLAPNPPASPPSLHAPSASDWESVFPVSSVQPWCCLAAEGCTPSACMPAQLPWSYDVWFQQQAGSSPLAEMLTVRSPSASAPQGRHTDRLLTISYLPVNLATVSTMVRSLWVQLLDLTAPGCLSRSGLRGASGSADAAACEGDDAAVSIPMQVCLHGAVRPKLRIQAGLGGFTLALAAVTLVRRF